MQQSNLSHNIFRKLSRHLHPFPGLIIISRVQFISVQIVLDEVFQMQIIIILFLFQTPEYYPDYQASEGGYSSQNPIKNSLYKNHQSTVYTYHIL